MIHASYISSPKLREWLLVGGLYLFELLSLIALFAFYRARYHPASVTFLISPSGLLFLGSTVSAIVVGGILVGLAVYDRRAGSNRWLFALLTNLIVIGCLILVTEGVLRLAVREKGNGEVLNGRLIYPRQWERVKSRYHEILARARVEQTWDVEDPLLGWSIGPNRTSENGLYKSSAEGLRAATEGEALFSQKPACRVALLGDSYTFGEHVPYEKTWAHHLDQALGSTCQVLNFGVGGYGIDQMYLRYTKDVRAWSPDIVILAFINHDVDRALSVYSFLLFPHGSIPMTKPRFVLHSNDLTIVNLPLISSDDVFQKASIRELPFIEYDAEYRATEWDQPEWALPTFFYGLRLLVSLYPPHEPARPEISKEQLLGIGRHIFVRFWNEVRADGAVPLVVYLPTEGDLEGPAWEPPILKILREENIPHIDLRPCMYPFKVNELFRPREVGGHYSEMGNRQTASCLSESVRKLIASSVVIPTRSTQKALEAP
jgi:hypothetical protein